jgi:hypothetical protein
VKEEEGSERGRRVDEKENRKKMRKVRERVVL